MKDRKKTHQPNERTNEMNNDDSDNENVQMQSQRKIK